MLRPSVTVRRKKELGQHFLADDNILRVIGRLAELGPDDVVLEIGPGLGGLTRYLAARVGRVYVVEVDRSLEPHLRDLPVELHFGDALRLDLAALAPDATKLVANLPYNVATPLIVESLDGLPGIRLWCVMVQREVAERFFAPPGTKSYGAVSVLVQLTAERTGFHPVARTCFRPPPNVDSALVAFRRRREWGPEVDALRKTVQAAFAPRRKTLVNSLELAGMPRRRAEEALAELAVPAGARAESLAPGEFLRLAELLA